MCQQSLYSAQRILGYIGIGLKSAKLKRSMGSKGGANERWLFHAYCNSIAFIATLV